MRPRKGTRAVAMVSVEHGAASSRVDEIVIEEPLEIRVAGDALTLTMRTPGDDRFLALGFLFAEGVIRDLSDVGSVYTCGRSDEPGYGNVIDIIPGPGSTLKSERLARARRTFPTSSACGVCGRESIDDLLTRCPSQYGRGALSTALIALAPELLACEQHHFARTGGLHAACAIDPKGKVAVSAEDIGRHNAVDKILGKLLYADRRPSTESGWMLAVSSRTGFEIVQKAAMAGFCGVVSISAPSSLAIETAQALGITLAAFARGGRFGVYAHPERLS